MKVNLYALGENVFTKNPQSPAKPINCVLYSNFLSFQIPNDTKIYPHSIDYSRFFIRYYKTKLILDFNREGL